MFANPVAQAYIRPFGSPSIIGNFRVTAPFGAIDASHPTPHNGVDIGNGKCGEPLLAMATGKITMNEYLDGPLGPNTVLVVRGIADANPNYEWAIAHCASVSVKVGQRVTAGEVVAVLGSTGTTACHAHLGCKQLIAGKWVSIDIWPLLNQNEEVVVVITVEPFPDPRVVVVKAPSTIQSYTIDTAKTGAVAKQKLTTWTKPSQTKAVAALTVAGKRYLQLETGAYIGQYVAADDPNLVLVTPPAVDVAATVKAATDPLNAKISALQTRLDGIVKLAQG